MKKKLSITILYTLVISSMTMMASAFTIVIDAGHGGDDFGAQGLHCFEKNINLDVALQLGNSLSKEQQARVVYTRTTDKTVSLQDRTLIANGIKADLFISIHCNSMPHDAVGRERVNGSTVYVMGQKTIDDNLKQIQRNVVIGDIINGNNLHQVPYDIDSAESNIAYEMCQNSIMSQSVYLANSILNNLNICANRKKIGLYQGDFVVLTHTVMPSVLIELDYISCPESERFMMSDKGVNEIVTAISKSVSLFINKFNK